MRQKYPSDLAERAFRFSCDIVTFTRELSAESGVVRNIFTTIVRKARAAQVVTGSIVVAVVALAIRLFAFNFYF